MKKFSNLELLDEIPSTNSYISELLTKDPNLPELYGVVTRAQRSGRGQRGNKWISEPGANITMSFLLRPQFLDIDQQFVLSEFAAISVGRTLAHFLTEEQKEELTVKWPNDVYYGDRKIAGILIEHNLTGSLINYSIVGLGININQTEFPDDIPNPISLKEITGVEHSIEEVLSELLQITQEEYRAIKKGKKTDLHERYLKHMYRRDGNFYPYESAEGQFKARIRTVQPNGLITLCHEDGELKDYAFKEVRFL